MQPYISRQYTVPLNLTEKTSSEEFSTGLARATQNSRDNAYAHIDRRICQLEKASGKRAVNKLYLEKFALSKGQPAVTVRVEFYLR